MTSSQISGPTTLLEAVRYFSDQDRAFEFVKGLRWGNGPVECPRCFSTENTFVSTRRIWKCRGCRRQFSLKVGTIFEDSPLGWDKWLPAVWLIANSKNSISSHELARSLGVTQKTAWFMLHRIRDAMETGTFRRLSGTVESDETYVGGLPKNMHAKAREARMNDAGGFDKTIVHGARQRSDGRVRAEVIPAASQLRLQHNLRRWVDGGSTIYTDEAPAYSGLDQWFGHKTVNHSVEYVSGDVTTNGIENFWALLKRALKGTQTHVAPFHMQRYVVERTFAYNNRTESDLTRLRLVMGGAPGRRLTWAALTDPLR